MSKGCKEMLGTDAGYQPVMRKSVLESGDRAKVILSVGPPVRGCAEPDPRGDGSK